MTETSIYLLGTHISEPMATATDLLLTAFCGYAFLVLKTLGKSHPWIYNWLSFFFAFGISTLIGAFAHGFRFYLEDKSFRLVWLCMNLSSVVSSFFLLLSIVEMSISITEQTNKKLRLAVIASSLIVAIITIILNDFILIKIYAGIIVSIVILTHFSSYRAGVKGSGWISFGFLFSTFSIIVHSLQFSIHKYFNFKDLSHVIMLISLCFILTGVLRKTLIVDSY